VSGFVTLLLAYQFAHLWIVTETSKAKQKLPTAYQYYLTMSLINGSKLTALFDTVQYMLPRAPGADPSRPFSCLHSSAPSLSWLFAG
jgi:hypothetical protein